MMVELYGPARNSTSLAKAEEHIAPVWSKTRDQTAWLLHLSCCGWGLLFGCWITFDPSFDAFRPSATVPCFHRCCTFRLLEHCCCHCGYGIVFVCQFQSTHSARSNSMILKNWSQFLANGPILFLYPTHLWLHFHDQSWIARDSIYSFWIRAAIAIGIVVCPISCVFLMCCRSSGSLLHTRWCLEATTQSALVSGDADCSPLFCMSGRIFSDLFAQYHQKLA